jgi:hypothetical protein
MTLKADILTDLASVFMNTDEFADSATYTHGATVATIKGIFDDTFQVVEGVESSGPSFLCATADVSAAAHGDTIVVSGATYYIRGIQPDGTGTTLLILSKE